MRTVYALAPVLVAPLALSAIASAQQFDATGQPIVIPSQSSVFNQNSMNLPSAPAVSGQDVVRGADGTTCQSAIASGGPYVDVGVLQSQDFYARDSAALYGRVVFPIGRRAKRVDCTRLYTLEIERMRMELELLRMGMAPGDSLDVREPAELMALDLTEQDEAGTGVMVPPPAARGSGGGHGLSMTASVPPRPVEAEAPRPAPTPSPAVEAETFIQTGAFSKASSAVAHLSALAERTGAHGISVVPMVAEGRTLYRALIGPMEEGAAKRLCTSLEVECFLVAG